MHVRAYPFTTVAAALTGNLLEANATAFEGLTGAVQIAVKVNSGSATAGVITVYQRLAEADTVYTEVPNAQYSLIAAASRISPIINLGAPGMFKLVVSGKAGTFNFDLLVRDVVLT